MVDEVQNDALREYYELQSFYFIEQSSIVIQVRYFIQVFFFTHGACYPNSYKQRNINK